MPFEKGQSGNPAGKKPGTKNKVSEEIREKLSSFINDNFETIQEDFKTMGKSYRWKFYTEVLPFVVPKLSSNENKNMIDGLTEDEAGELLQQLKDQLLKGTHEQE